MTTVRSPLWSFLLCTLALGCMFTACTPDEGDRPDEGEPSLMPSTGAPAQSGPSAENPSQPGDNPSEPSSDCAEMVDHVIGLIRRDQPSVLANGEEEIRNRMMKSCSEIGVKPEDRKCILNAGDMRELKGCNTH